MEEICKYHERVHKDIPQQEGTLVGQIRKGCVRAGRYQAPCGKEVPELMERLLDGWTVRLLSVYKAMSCQMPLLKLLYSCLFFIYPSLF